MSFETDLASAVRPRASRLLRAEGLSKHLLDGPRYRRTTPGRYVPTPVETSPTQRIVEAAAHLPPGAALAGWAAAYALGADHLDGLDSRLRPLPVTMSVADPLHRVATPALRYVRQELSDKEMVDVGGISFTSPARTACDLARWAANQTEAVVALDILLQAEVLTEPELAAAAATLAGRRGARQARSAFALARSGARSPGETRLRMAYVLGVGAPSPLINPTVYDEQGFLLGIPDLLDVEAGLVLEYDGASWASSEREAGHRDRVQHREDNVREEGFERTGLVVVRADSADVSRHRDALRLRLVAARADGLSRDRTRDRWVVARAVALPDSADVATGNGYRSRTTVDS